MMFVIKHLVVGCLKIHETMPKSSIDLSQIKSPADIKSMTLEQLETLAAELRTPLIRKIASHGGHVGPNLGFLEATIALHFVFDAPADKLVFDVSHQTYVHKMLTGRINAFLSPEHYDDVTGYTNPGESIYDEFSIGHTSTSISLASGLAKARDLRGGNENIVAVIGDGSLSGGEAFEGLDYAATLGTNFIVAVNDNQMSIAPNHGGLYDNLRELRETNGTARCNYFRSLGFKYIYVPYGNDIHSLIQAFNSVKNSTEPVVVHINTTKGMGLPVAERDKETFHFSAPFDPTTGEPLNPAKHENYIDAFATHMLKRMANDPRICTITAGTPGAIGFSPQRRQAAGKQFIDVGIAEEQAVGMASGMAKGGCRPVFGVCATFLQRAYDQLSQDVAINGNPAVFVTFYGGAWGMNDETHLGFFDVPMITGIPGILFLAPTNMEEYTAMLDWAIDQTETPVVIRTPCGKVTHADRPVPTDYSNIGYETVEQGSDVAVIAAGDFMSLGKSATLLMREKGINPTLINPRVLSHLDTTTLDTLKTYKTVITLEDNSLDGGIGQKIAAYLGASPVMVHCLGLPKAFPNRYTPSALLASCNLTPEAIASLAC